MTHSRRIKALFVVVLVLGLASLPSPLAAGQEPLYDDAIYPYVPGPDEYSPLDLEALPEGDLDFEPAPIDHWFAFEAWAASFELGINGSEGNSETLNVQSGFKVERDTERSETEIALRYATTRANNVETQNNALLKSRHEWLFQDSPWSAFVQSELLYDQFKAFDLRLVLNGGLAYTHFANEQSRFKTRYGAGTSREFGGPDDRWVPEALFGADYERQLTKKQKFQATVDYYPDWTDFMDYRVVTDLSWELVLDQEANLSLKASVVDSYDSTPNGARPNDLNYALLLLWSL